MKTESNIRKGRCKLQLQCVRIRYLALFSCWFHIYQIYSCVACGRNMVTKISRPHFFNITADGFQLQLYVSGFNWNICHFWLITIPQYAQQSMLIWLDLSCMIVSKPNLLEELGVRETQNIWVWFSPNFIRRMMNGLLVTKQLSSP